MKDILNKLVDMAESLARRTLDFLNWRLISALGQLHILTKASYVMLIVVPLLAGMWPAIRAYVNQHNKHAAELATNLEKAQIRLEETQKSAAPDFTKLLARFAPEALEQSVLRKDIEATAAKFNETADILHTTVSAFKSDFSERTLKDPKLPWSFAAAFFAALFAVLAHLVYQLFAPDVIKATTLDEFVSNRKDQYAKHPSQDALQRAEEFARTALGKRAQREDFYGAEHLLRGLLEMPEKERPSFLRSLDQKRLRLIANYLANTDTQRNNLFNGEIRDMVDQVLDLPEKRDFREMTIIERGAKAEYLYSAGRAPLAIIATAFLYAIAVCVVLSIIWTQATSVMDAAGWTSVSQLLTH